MTEELTNMFSENTTSDTIVSARSLAGTAQLTNISTMLATEALKKIEADFQTYKDLVTASKADHGAMDNLVKAAVNLDCVDVKFLMDIKETDADMLDGMLKSQQSKRSRAKGKVMTMDNYKAMMTGAIAELLLRQVLGTSKNSTGPRRFAGETAFTDEQLVELANDQDKLRRELRNVQSKKSIMKSKEGFKESDPRWQALLVAEQQLKDRRTDTQTIVKVDETRTKLEELLAQVTDINKLKPAEAKKLLEEIKELTAKEDAAPSETQANEEV